MILNLITLSTVKLQIGVSSTEYDAGLTAIIPIVSNDVRRILNYNYDKSVVSLFESGQTTIDFGVSGNAYYEPFYHTMSLPFPLGQVVYHPNIPEDTYLSAYNNDNGVYTLSQAATGNGDYVFPSVQISQWPAIAKMCWYKLSAQTTTDAEKRNVQSISYGPVSKTFADSEINQRWNYPQTLINELGTPYAHTG